MWFQVPVQGEAFKMAAQLMTFDGHDNTWFHYVTVNHKFGLKWRWNGVSEVVTRWAMAANTLKVLGAQASTLFTRVYDAH